MSRVDSNPIPMPPPVSSTLMNLQAPNTFSSNEGYRMRPGGAEAIAPPTLPASVINLSNSSDVVIGPMTQYKGSVTIYQYMDATVQGRTQSVTGTNNQQEQEDGSARKSSGTNKFCSAQTFFLTSIILLIGIGFLIRFYTQFFQVHPLPKEDQPRNILFTNDYMDETIPNLGGGHLLIDRRQWGATNTRQLNKHFPLHQPIQYIIITHIGVQTRPCDNVYSCSVKMRTIQDSAIAEKGLYDLPANFYVSSDGYVYVGRGWEFANAYTNTSLAICFMGDYIRYEPTSRQLEGVRYLLDFGVSKRFISDDYKVVAHNQTTYTKSPGSNVYREIKKWSRWYPCGVESNPQCEPELRVN